MKGYSEFMCKVTVVKGYTILCIFFMVTLFIPKGLVYFNNVFFIAKFWAFFIVITLCQFLGVFQLRKFGVYFNLGFLFLLKIIFIA